MRFFLLLFVLIPLLEIVLLIQIGGEIGALATIAWLIIAAVLGLALVRLQGVATLMQARTMMAQGKAPAEALANGLLLAFAGVLLIVPGFASDAIAFLCLIPAFRRLLLRRWLGKMRFSTTRGGNVYEAEVSDASTTTKPERITPRPGQTLEGEFKRDE